MRRGDVVLKADPQQLDLLCLFLQHPDELLSRQQILDAVWDGRVVAENVLSVAVAKLRKVLGPRVGGREYIENRYGRGYRFVPQVDRVALATVRSAPDTLLRARRSQPRRRCIRRWWDARTASSS